MKTTAFIDLVQTIQALAGALFVLGSLGLVLALIRAHISPTEEGKLLSLSHAAQVLAFIACIGGLGLIASWLWSIFADPAGIGNYFLRFFSLF